MTERCVTGRGAGRLVFYYGYGMGGWGDLIKGLHTCWCWAKASGRELEIDFRQHVFGSIFPQYKTGVDGRVGIKVLNLIDKAGTIGTKEIKELAGDKVLVVLCNWFHPGAVEGVDATTVLEFYDRLYTDIFPVADAAVMEAGTYRVFHCRMGDKYLSEAYACKGDNRIGSMGVLAEQIRAFVGGEGSGKGEEGGKTMVCSDHASVIRSLLTQIPNSFCVCTEPYHIAYHSQDIEQRIGSIKAMIYEHYTMTRSAEIWMAAYSGFPITAAVAGNVPLLLAGETYRDAYVDFVRGLRA